MNVSRIHTRDGIRILITRRAGRKADRPRVQRRVGVANVRPGSREAVYAIRYAKRSTGLESCDAGNRPPGQGVFPPACSRPGNGPQVSDGHAVWAIEIRHSTVELQPSLYY